LKPDRERACERGRADGQPARQGGQLLSVLTRRGRIFGRNLSLRSNEASRADPPQDRPSYFQSTLLEERPLP
jgi:hypothetical protein